MLPRGATLGRYVVLELVGAGGMGVVYAAYDFGLDRKVSLKLVRGDRKARERQERLVREAQAMARLSHPNVIAVHDVGTYEDQVFIAMEFVSGGSLKQWLHAQPRAWQEVVDVLLQAGRGLAAAHRAGLVHRDFKPENVLLDAEGRARVTDFGLAIPADQADERTVAIRTDGTLSISGTEGYIAPELRRGLPADPRSDQYAFCVSLHEGLCGERPTNGVASEALLAARVPRPLVRLLDRGLSPEPADRFPTLDGLLAELDRCRHPGRRRLAVGGLSFAGSMAALGALVLASQPRPAVPAPAAPVSTHVVTWLPVPVGPAACTLPSGGEHVTPLASVTQDTHEPRLRASRAEPPAPRAVEVRTPALPPAPVSFAQAAAFAPAARAPRATTSWADETRRLIDNLRHEDVADHPLTRLVATVLERLQRLLDGSPDLENSPSALLASNEGVGGSGVTWQLVTPQAAAAPSANPFNSASLNVGHAPRLPPLDQRSVDALEFALAQNMADHKSPAEIAQVRFALAQALWATRRDPDRALALAQQAQDDLQVTREHPELEVEVSSWLKEKLELRRSNPDLYGSSGP